MPHSRASRAPPSEAEFWRERSRERSAAGAEATARLASCYRTGRGGVQLNPRRAVELYKDAAERGSVDGAYFYGSMLMAGVPGLRQNFPEVVGGTCCPPSARIKPSINPSIIRPAHRPRARGRRPGRYSRREELRMG